MSHLISVQEGWEVSPQGCFAIASRLISLIVVIPSL